MAVALVLLPGINHSHVDEESKGPDCRLPSPGCCRVETQHPVTRTYSTHVSIVIFDDRGSGHFLVFLVPLGPLSTHAKWLGSNVCGCHCYRFVITSFDYINTIWMFAVLQEELLPFFISTLSPGRLTSFGILFRMIVPVPRRLLCAK